MVFGMARLRTIHVCTECAGSTPKWAGRCPQCGAWNSLVEDVEEVGKPSVPAGGAGGSGGSGGSGGFAGFVGGSLVSGVAADMPLPIAEVDSTQATPRSTGVTELDRVLGGGFVPGSVTLVGGEPGIGKSTLLLQALAGLSRSGGRGLLVTAEESKQQVRLRAERLGALPLGLWLVAESSLANIVDALDQVQPDYLVVDSIQTVMDHELGSLPGSVAQVRGCAHRLVQEAKQRNMATVLVGHVTKEGSLAGPRVLEHLVDTVLSFEGERHHALRLLRAVKHRFGPTGELGLFEMGEDGLITLPDPSALFLGDRRTGASGSVVVPAMAGHRPLLVELQALVAPTKLPMPRRSTSGLDSGRLGMLTAVLDRRCGVELAGLDVYASVVGGVKVVE